MNECKYCLEESNWFLISPCLCKNKVHVSCIYKWLKMSKSTHCPECKYDLVNDNEIIKFYSFFTGYCLRFLEFCDMIFHNFNQR